MATTNMKDSATRISDQELPAFTEAVCRRLPRELRDEIYSHLWDADTIDQYASFPAIQEHRKDEPTFPRFLKVPESSHQLAYEAMEWVFSSAGRINVGDPVDFTRFLDSDAYNLGLKPVNYSLRGLTFIFKLPDAELLELINEGWENHYAFPTWVQKYLREDFAVHIKFILETGVGRDMPPMWDVVKGLKGAVHELEHLGHKVTADCTAIHFRREGGTGRLLEKQTIKDYDVTEAFQLTRPGWLEFWWQMQRQMDYT